MRLRNRIIKHEKKHTCRNCKKPIFLELDFCSPDCVAEFEDRDSCTLCGKWEEVHKKDFDHVFQSIQKRDKKMKKFNLIFKDFWFVHRPQKAITVYPRGNAE